MKKVIFSSSLLVIFAVVGFCGEPCTKLEQAIEGYIQGIKSDNPGLQMSAMQQLIKVKMIHPGLNCSKAIKILSVIRKNEKLSSVRVCATLTHLLLSDNHMLQLIKEPNVQDPPAYFNNVFSQMNEHLNQYMIDSVS